MNDGEPPAEKPNLPGSEKPQTGKQPEFWLVRYWWLLSCLAGLLIVANLLVQYRWQWVEDYLISALVVGLIGLYLPWVAASIQRSTQGLFPHIEAILAEPQAQANQHTFRRVRQAFRDPLQYFIAIFLALFGAATLMYFGIPWTGGVLVLELCWLGLLGALVGIVAYDYVIALLLIYRLVRKTLRFEIFRSQEAAIKKIYQTYMGFFWMGAALYVAAVFGISFSPTFWQVLNTPLGQLWVFPVAVLAINFFLSIQVCIHLIQAKIKEQRLQALETLLAENYRAWEAAPSQAQATLLQGLVGWHAAVKGETDWPISVVSTITVIGSLLIPSISVVVDLMR